MSWLATLIDRQVSKFANGKVGKSANVGFAHAPVGKCRGRIFRIPIISICPPMNKFINDFP